MPIGYPQAQRAKTDNLAASAGCPNFQGVKVVSDIRPGFASLKSRNIVELDPALRLHALLFYPRSIGAEEAISSYPQSLSLLRCFEFAC
jgi:hypothetical protein